MTPRGDGQVGPQSRRSADEHAALVWSACASSSPDPRSRIRAEGKSQAKLARFVNGSRIWQAYFEEVDPAGTRALMEVELSMERKRYASTGGDYDRGKVTFHFEIVDLRNGGELFYEKVEVDLDSLMIGFFSEDATRDEIQEIAFQATEKKIFPYAQRWMDIAGLRAMKAEASSNFVPFLEAMEADEWVSADLKEEVIQALKVCR